MSRQQTFNTSNTSGGTINNVGRDYINNIARALHIHINVTSGSPEFEEVLERLHGAHIIRSISVSQPLQPHPPEPPTNQIARIDACYASATRSIIEVQAMIGVVRIMMDNPTLRSSKDLPETLASLHRILKLTELALRAYQHTPLVKTISRAISVGVEDCRLLLRELIKCTLSNYRHGLTAFVRYFIQKCIRGRIGRYDAVRGLDSKLQESHRSFAACILALGS